MKTAREIHIPGSNSLRDTDAHHRSAVSARSVPGSPGAACPSLEITRNTNPRIKLFFRAEVLLVHLRPECSQNFQQLKGIRSRNQEKYGLQLAKGVAQGQAKSLEQKYGENRTADLWRILLSSSRTDPSQGTLPADEPETPLSPILDDTEVFFTSKSRKAPVPDCQSPMLMAFPGAQILSLDQNPIRLECEDVEYVRMMKRFGS